MSADLDLEALADLFQRWQGLFHRTAWEVLRDYDAAADVVQEAFIEVAARYGGVEPNAAVSYIRSTVRNIAIDAWRERQQCSTVTLEVADWQPDWSSDPAMRAGARDGVRAVADVWWMLGERDARLLGLVVQGYDLTEISEREGMKRIAAKVAIHRARTRLRDLLGMTIVKQPASEKTRCDNGHPYNETNTYRYPDGRRACRACIRISGRLSYQRKKDAA